MPIEIAYRALQEWNSIDEKSMSMSEAVPDNMSPDSNQERQNKSKKTRFLSKAIN